VYNFDVQGCAMDHRVSNQPLAAEAQVLWEYVSDARAYEC